ncbi:MAG: extracellular solute-binding protein [Anaerolineales bacterium]|jgi:ABC-type glycerol-3-phosphate transport system substrate-binding protein
MSFRLTWLSSSLLLLALLSACGQVSPAHPPTAGPTAPAPTTSAVRSTPSIQPTALQIDPNSLRGIKLQIWDAFIGSAATAFANQVALFNTTNSWGIVVYPTAYSDYPTLSDAITTSITSGGKPDLVAALPEQVLAWEAAGAVVDLNPYVSDPIWGLKSSEIADIPAVFWAQDSVGGRRLGIPAQRSTDLLFYNKTWAHELGFTHPPATADEFRQQACAANASFRAGTNPQKYGYGGWVVDTTWPTVLAWMTAYGGGVAGEGGYHFQSAANLSALQAIKKLYEDHCAWISTEPTPFDAFAQRLALFVSGDLAEVPLAEESMSRFNNRDEWTVLPYPGVNTSALIAYGPSYALLTSNPVNQLAAWLFVRWTLSPDNQINWIKSAWSLPLRNSVMSSLGNGLSGQPQWEAAALDVPFLTGTPELASWQKVSYALEDGSLSIFRTNLPLAQIGSVLDQMDAMAQELSK